MRTCVDRERPALFCGLRAKEEIPMPYIDELLSEKYGGEMRDYTIELMSHRVGGARAVGSFKHWCPCFFA